MRARCSREMRSLAPQWLHGCRLRECWFEPTFHKHVGKLCAGVQIHVEDAGYEHDAFRPWRVQALAFKALRRCSPTIRCGATFRMNTRTIGSPSTSSTAAPLLREWVDDPQATPADLDAITTPDEESWREEREDVLIYR